MAKGKKWPWVVGALFFGYILGSTSEEESKLAVVPKPAQTADETVAEVKLAPKGDRIVSKPKPILVIPKKRPPNEAKNAVFKKRVMFVDASRLNVRNQPAKTGKQVWTLKRDEKVTVTNEEGEWLYVKGQRYAGWVFGTYLTNKPSPKPAVTKPVAVQPALSTAKIKDILIKRSWAYYSGNCPCPYNTMRNGRRCGGRSAYSKPGGAEPLCYPQDVTDAMVAEYRARQ